MGLTASTVDVCNAIKQKLIDTKNTTGLEDIFYGDQTLIATTPIACVEPGPKQNVLSESAVYRKLNIEFTEYIIVYISKVTSTEINAEDADTLGEVLEGIIHQDRQLGGLLTHCYV